jgi:hypothetical protein
VSTSHPPPAPDGKLQYSRAAAAGAHRGSILGLLRGSILGSHHALLGCSPVATSTSHIPVKYKPRTRTHLCCKYKPRTRTHPPKREQKPRTHRCCNHQAAARAKLGPAHSRSKTGRCLIYHRRCVVHRPNRSRCRHSVVALVALILGLGGRIMEQNPWRCCS